MGRRVLSTLLAALALAGASATAATDDQLWILTAGHGNGAAGSVSATDLLFLAWTPSAHATPATQGVTR